jgi:hypothetical protein
LIADDEATPFGKDLLLFKVLEAASYKRDATPRPDIGFLAISESEGCPNGGFRR